LIENRTQEANRLQKVLETANIKLAHHVPLCFQQTPHRRRRVYIHAKIPHSSLPSVERRCRLDRRNVWTRV
jgi:arginine/lysine/ornithine decarboxylase